MTTVSLQEKNNALSSITTLPGDVKLAETLADLDKVNSIDAKLGILKAVDDYLTHNPKEVSEDVYDLLSKTISASQPTAIVEKVVGIMSRLPGHIDAPVQKGVNALHALGMKLGTASQKKIVAEVAVDLFVRLPAVATHENNARLQQMRMEDDAPALSPLRRIFFRAGKSAPYTEAGQLNAALDKLNEIYEQGVVERAAARLQHSAKP